MLKPLGLYVDEVNKKAMECFYYNKEYQYYFENYNFDIAYRYDNNSTYNNMDFASVKQKDGQDQIIGIIRINVDRNNNCITSIAAISFNKRELEFSKDCVQVIHDCFLIYKFNKIRFSGFSNNPAIRSYQALMDRIGGKKVGEYEEEAKILDGSYVNDIVFECLRKNFKPIINHRVAIDEKDLEELYIYKQVREFEEKLRESRIKDGKQSKWFY